MPCMPATKTKSPALTPRLQVPSALMAPGGLSVLTPFGDGDCAKPGECRHARKRKPLQHEVSLLQQLLTRPSDQPMARTTVQCMRTDLSGGHDRLARFSAAGAISCNPA